MSNNKSFFFFAAFVLFLSASPAWAQAETAPAPDLSFTVADILIDKTDKNAVVAREQAIMEARREAFRRLAGRSMTPEAFAALTLPDDATIALLVQDFAIRNEQISADRYVASFTVRFAPQVADYIANPQPPSSVAAAAVGATTTRRDILVLPYAEAAGKKILWEDPNPWREAWQAVGNSAPAPGMTITVPLGDLADMSAGSTDAVWAGDTSVLEKLRGIYNTNEVALVTQGRTIDIHLYREGRLVKMAPVTPEAGATLPQTVAQVVSALRTGAIMEEATATSAVAAPVSLTPPPAGAPRESAVLDVVMNFSNPAAWMEAQRRLASVSPSPAMQILSLTQTSVRFTLVGEQGAEALGAALAEKGLVLKSPVVEVDVSVIGSDQPTQRMLYELELVN